MMPETVVDLLMRARKALVAADIDGSALDARLLFQAASGLSHEDVVASPGAVVSDDVSQRFSDFLNRRLSREPVSRILGAREFYGRDFLVSPAVLDPRADTETIVDLALAKVAVKQGRLLDLGTGSGAIAITLLAELPQFTGVAVDVSAAALDVAQQNALNLAVADRLAFHEGTWFQGIDGQFDLILSNPPYILHGVIAGLEAEVKNYDPHLALDGGADGLDAYRAIAASAAPFLALSGLVIVEIGAGQALDVIAIFTAAGFQHVTEKADLGGHVRALGFGHRN